VAVLRTQSGKVVATSGGRVSAGNCGTGHGGFKAGNTCAKGGKGKADDADAWDGDPQREAARGTVDRLNDDYRDALAGGQNAAERLSRDAVDAYREKNPPNDDTPEADDARYDAAKDAVAEAMESNPLKGEFSDVALQDAAGELSDTGKVSTGTFRESVEEWAAGKGKELIDGAVARAPEGQRAYLQQHTERLTEAFEASPGRVDADRVFAETDKGVKAIPAKAAETFRERAEAEFKARAGGTDDDNRDAAGAAVAAAMRKSPRAARPRLRDDADELADILSREGSIPPDYFD
jgi:hypothetical protein